MPFKSYQHLERLGTTETQNIELGDCHVFPKIDGTNASVWMDNAEVKAGSRRRELTLDYDNAGFYAWVLQQENIKNFLLMYPTLRLFGEWLVPHSLKTYKESAWNNFYVFDVCTDNEDGSLNYIPYEQYKGILQDHDINYIHPIAIINNGSYEHFVKQLANNVFLIEDGKGCGEGIVLKNYGYKNRFGRQVWAKIVTSEFKEQHAKTMGAPSVKGKALVEEAIAEAYVTQALVDKEHSKIDTEVGWTSKLIPRLLNTVFYSIVKEEAWEFVKEHKQPVIDFKRLQHFVFAEVKRKKPELF